jgi:hypothetical protein
MPLGQTILLIEMPHIQHIAKDTPIPIKLPRLQSGSHSGKTLRIVSLVAIDTKDPGIGAGEGLDQIVTDPRMTNMMQLDLTGELRFQLF